MSRCIFLRVAWMKYYQGVNENDIPVGAGWWVSENEDGGEVYNFKPINGKYYGYARIQGGRNLRIERVGASLGSESVTDITIIYFGRNPQTGGQYIIGWYKHATLYRRIQQLNNNQRGNQPIYLSYSQIKNGYLVPEDERVFEVPEDGPGQTNAWYVEEYRGEYLTKVNRYINDPDNYFQTRRRTNFNGHAWQSNAELRKRVEIAAMNTVAEYFAFRGYRVEYRHDENLGLDLEATLNSRTLLLEVKGLSGEFNSVELTPNEYRNAMRKVVSYRICVVSNALNYRKKLQIFYYLDGQWINNENRRLQVREIISARFSI